MVISRDRKKIKLNETSAPAVKETNWNFLVIALSTIMAFIGIPSMFSACFPDSRETWGVTVFLICASVIAFFLGILYWYIPFTLLKKPVSGFETKLLCFLLALMISFIPVTIYSLIKGNLACFSICLIIVSILFLVLLLIAISLTPPPKEGVRFKISSQLWPVSLILLPIGAIIYSIGILLSFNQLLLIIGIICIISGIVLSLIRFVLFIREK
ncbi:MAG: hypothetical protein Q7J08_05905 [Methanocorpusculum sp.]|uniref:hypothetical protein n=1 Tax=Methanocorpusculum sp. TaxID=2058474 RepID=UPI0027288128|nr:hypothetical protein [Methanocorpusculum sp.]MDO9523231.1 hypothetical protein [Methanocorpusculum sp.]